MTTSSRPPTRDHAPPPITRRTFLRVATAAVVAPSLLPARTGDAASDYAVGVGVSESPYVAALRAIDASTGWDPAAIAGKRVVIKPNLVVGASPVSGTVTDARAVRALVDRALAAGAVEIIIIEGGASGANFQNTGYGFFSEYDPLGRVRLLDLNDTPTVAAPTHTGLAYSKILLPALIFEPDIYFITAAKMKVHNLTQATLAMKNYFGLPPVTPYLIPGRTGRFGMHERSVNQTVIDLYAARPADFALIDASWAMERAGPMGGDPVRLDTVIAGRNTLAVDLVGLATMQMPLERVRHLHLAASLGFGPSSLAEVTVLGDPLPTHPFVLPATIPLVHIPRITPSPYVPSAGPARIVTHVDDPGLLRVEIVQPSSASTALPRVALVSDWQSHPAGIRQFTWDGSTVSGGAVPPGIYAVRISSQSLASPRELHCWGWVQVVG